MWFVANVLYLTSLLQTPYKHAFRFFASLCGSRVNTPHMAVILCRMTCIHANVSRSPREHSSVAPDKRHCRQWMSSLFRLFCGFLPNPFIHDLFLWRTSQEFAKTDLYPLSLMSLRYAVCSITDHCFGACQQSSCAEERWPQKKKNSHLILEMSMNEAFIWLSGLCLVVRTLFHWQTKLLMTRNFFWIFTENKRVRGLRKKYNIPDVNWLSVFSLNTCWFAVVL